MHESQDTPRHGHEAPAAQPRTSAFAAPRLELPRFQFSTPTTLARAEAAPAPSARPARAAAPMTPRAPQLFAHPPRAPYAAPAAPAGVAAPVAAPHAPVPHTPAPAYQYSATAMPQPVAVAVAPAPAPAPAPVAVAAPSRIPNLNATAPAPVAWQQPAPARERSWLQRITPVHMGALLVLVLVAMVVTAGPASMHAKPTRLPAVVSGGGTGDVPLPPRAGATATAAAAAVGATRARATAVRTPTARTIAPRSGAAPARRMLRVGTARVPAGVRAGGIPSPAAAANLAVTGGGRAPVGQTGAIRMNGIPSPAAAAAMGPQQLPFRPSDGVTLPRAIGERDSHAVDSHYGTSTLPMEEPAAPVMTPGQSAAHAERQVTLNELTGGTSSDHPQPAAPAAGGYATAY